MPVFLKRLVLFAAILAGTATRAQKVFFEQLTTAEGLPSDYVNCVFRDSKGFLWIATDKGACRYDGRQFLYLNKDNGLISNFVNCFSEDPAGNIWLATLEGGICKYDGKKVIPFPTYNSEFANTRQIHFNDDKSFFLVTTYSLYYCKSENAEPEKIKDCSGYLAPVSKNRFIAGNGRDIIYELEKTGHKLALHELHGQTFFKIVRDEFITRNGNELNSYTINEKQLVPKKKFILKKNPLPANEAEIKDLYVTKNALFVATASGLIYADEKNNELFLNSSNGMGADYIRSIYEDGQGNLFFCTFGGGVKIWPNLYLQEFNVEGKVTSVFPSDKQIYITTTRNVYQFNPLSNQFSSFPNLSGGNYTAVYQTTQGRFFLGTLNSFFELPGEAVLHSLDKKKLSLYAIYANTGTSGFLSKNDSLFISTYGEGIIVYDRNKKHTFRFSMTGPGIVEFLVPLKNCFAALTYSSGLGLFYETNVAKQISTKEGLLSNTVYSVFQEKENEIWIGTLKGLNLYDGKTVSSIFSEQEGLIGSKVICIFRDAQKRFWILSDKYLHLLEKDKLRAIRSHPILYDPKNSINRAAYDQQTDLLYIGLNNALLTVDLKKIVPDTSIQRPGIARILIDTTLMTGSEATLQIPPGSAKLIIDFSNHFTPLARKNDLYYKLKGFDDDWHLVDNSAEAVYQKLPAGNYELLARSINPDGYASPETSLLKLEVLPPLWKRTWFIVLLSSLLLAGFFFTGQIISKKRYKQKILRLQEEYRLQSERERIAMELHDNVGSQLTYLINKIDDDYPLLADKQEAGKLSNFARGAMQELRETIWALDKKEVLLYDLDHKVMQLADLFNREKNIVRYSWNSNSPQSVSLKSLQALNIYRIIQESLNNAVKYSGAKNIYVIIEMTGAMMDVKVTDDGKGFDLQKIVPGYGLRNMKNRAVEMNALFTVKSEPGKGTVVSLSVPVS